MSDSVKAATLEPCAEPKILEMIAEMIPLYHPSLEGAKLRLFWMIGKPLSNWGGAAPVSELEWWLSGALDGEGVDGVLRLNKSLWAKLSDEGRKGYVDLCLFGLRRKEAGKTSMATVAGDRGLFEKVTDSLKLPAEVVARRPVLARELEEVRRLFAAMTDPEQFRLQFGPEAGGGHEEKADGEPGEEPAAGGNGGPARAASPRLAQYHYRARDIEGYGPLALRYSEADERVSSLAGVHFFDDTEQMEEASRSLGDLAYDGQPHVLRSVRGALEDERNARGQVRPAVTLEEVTM